MSTYNDLQLDTVEVITRLKPHSVSLVVFTMKDAKGERWVEPYTGQSSFGFTINPRFARGDTVYAHCIQRFETMVQKAFNVPTVSDLDWNFTKAAPQRLVIQASEFYIERGYQYTKHRKVGTQWMIEQSVIKYQPQLNEGNHVNWEGVYQTVDTPHMEGPIAWSRLEHHIWVNREHHLKLLKGI
jgi:hypothetical protein